MAKRSEARTEHLRDWLVTACEGGIGYWSLCHEYDHEEGYAVVAPLLDDESGYDEDNLITVTLDDIAKAIGKIRRGEEGTESGMVPIPPGYRAYILDIYDTMNGDLRDLKYEDMDASTADVVFQVAALGGLIYG